MKRYALASLRMATSEQVARYLPENYRVVAYVPHDSEAPDICSYGACVLIEGRDRAGWTLDAYVLPRLSSGLIEAQEIDLSHPVLKTIPD
jgi:hypothetical protein